MLSEYALNGRVSLKLFYARRVLRLFPASYAFIACVCLLWWAGVVHLQATDIWHAVTYTVNYLPGRSWQIGHLWSLSVEEQFYLIWPCTFALLGLRRAGWVAAGVVLFGPVARSTGWLLLRGTPYGELEMFPMVADSLAMGCLLAKIGGWLEGKSWYLQLFRPAYSFGLVALILLINRYSGYTVVAVFGTSVVNASLAVLIHRSVYCSSDWIGQSFNWRPIAFAGVLSYSLYLWQQLFLEPEFYRLGECVSAKPCLCGRGGAGIVFSAGEATAQASPSLARVTARQARLHLAVQLVISISVFSSGRFFCDVSDARPFVNCSARCSHFRLAHFP